MLVYSLIDILLELLSAVKVPISILGAEIDPISPPEVVKQFEEVLTARPEVGIYFSSKQSSMTLTDSWTFPSPWV